MESLRSLIPRPYRRGRFAAPWHRPGYDPNNSTTTSTEDENENEEDSSPRHILLYKPAPEPDPEDEELWWRYVGPPFVRMEGHASYRRRRKRILPEDVLKWANGEIETVRELVENAPPFDQDYGEEYDKMMEKWDRKRRRMRRRREREATAAAAGRDAAAAAATEVDAGGRATPPRVGPTVDEGDDEDSTDGEGPQQPEDWDDALDAAIWRNAVRGGLVDPPGIDAALRPRRRRRRRPSRPGDGFGGRRDGDGDPGDEGDVDANADVGEGGDPAADPAAANPAAAPLDGDRIGLFDDFEEDEEWLRLRNERREIESRNAIAREVGRLRDAGVPEDEFELVRIDAEEDDGNNALTLRRILFAVLAVVVAFVCIMIQAASPIFMEDDDPAYDDDDDGVPSPQVRPSTGEVAAGGRSRSSGVFGGGGGSGSSSSSSSDVDHLMHELMEVRDVVSFCRDCGRGGGVGGDAFLESIYNLSETTSNSFYDCGDGVLHVPTVSKLRSAFPPPPPVTTGGGGGGRGVAGESSTTSTSLGEESSLSPTLVASTPRHSVEVSAGGINATWWYDCRWPVPVDGNGDDVDERQACLSGPGDDGDGTCDQRVPGSDGGGGDSSTWWWSPLSPSASSSRRASSSPRCFRGVHDGVFDDEDVDALLAVAAELIGEGGDHLAIRDDVEGGLIGRVPPGVLRSLGRLLRERYGMGLALGRSPETDGCEAESVAAADWNATGSCETASSADWDAADASVARAIRPVAFRFNAAISPIPNQFSPKNKLLEKILNERTVQKWIEPMVQKHLKDSLLSFLFSSSAKPSLLLKEDPCYLLSDLEARDDFVVHTTIFLSEKGAREDHGGGTSFFLEEAEWRAHQRRGRRRHKYRKGLAVDGSRGRLIVSTGGLENLRCRLPVKAGVRAALQIWWDCAA